VNSVVSINGYPCCQLLGKYCGVQMLSILLLLVRSIHINIDVVGAMDMH